MRKAASPVYSRLLPNPVQPAEIRATWDYNSLTSNTVLSDFSGLSHLSSWCLLVDGVGESVIIWSCYRHVARQSSSLGVRTITIPVTGIAGVATEARGQGKTHHLHPRKSPLPSEYTYSYIAIAHHAPRKCAHSNHVITFFCALPSLLFIPRAQLFLHDHDNLALLKARW